MQVVHAVDALCLALGGGERRQQHGRQNGNDGNHDEQFDERKGLFVFEDAFDMLTDFSFLFRSGDSSRASLKARSLTTHIPRNL